ncbi:hypothetical protein [Massilia pseudoviolaceinigra]|uniref:hypothetical protein n=1 Tax=Massilia pseudoviolaceinigra TaxID=3057165 RepID=UPI0027969568|nr:hypothetical protein [Massilia sp. CCM 9206]MDQ1923046.1 hypothetical protein [Massilia sp. CCM 9206]
MPSDIQVYLEERWDGRWQLVLPMIKTIGFDDENPRQDWLNDTTYLTGFYPQDVYSEYNPPLWELFGVAGRFPSGLRGLPAVCCTEIKNHFISFGTEAFDEHCLPCTEFRDAVAALPHDDKEARRLLEQIAGLGKLEEMRLILWFSQ